MKSYMASGNMADPGFRPISESAERAGLTVKY